MSPRLATATGSPSRFRGSEAVAIVDLSAPDPPSGGLIADLPRRLTLTLPELQWVARAAGGAPLPFESPDDSTSQSTGAPAGGLEARLGRSRGSRDTQAYAAALASLREPAVTLTRRGLLGNDQVDPALLGAVGLLATPRVAVDLDVAVAAEGGEPGAQVKAWHRQAGEAVATLATSDGVVFELAWFAATHWSDELSRAAVLPESMTIRTSEVPRVDLPFELLDAAAEAIRIRRHDLLPVLARQVTGTLLRGPDLVRILQALSGEARGRLRALVARVDPDGDAPRDSATGVVSWTLLGDGWRSLRTHERDGALWVDITPVRAGDLASDLGPALAEVRG